jgi:quercetin dioxygenase-like cupin family protein
MEAWGYIRGRTMNLHHLSEYRDFAPEKLRKHAVFSTPRFFLDVYCLKPGQSQAAHAHKEADKVYLGLEGTPVVVVDGETRPLKPGDAVHCPAGSTHALLNQGEADARVLVFVTPNPGKS